MSKYFVFWKITEGSNYAHRMVSKENLQQSENASNIETTNEDMVYNTIPLKNTYIFLPFYTQLLGWHCQAECKYLSMWNTVDYFQHNTTKPIPQFNGKVSSMTIFVSLYSALE